MNRTQKWQKIAENRLVIMNDMEKQNDALEQQNRDLVAALEAVSHSARATKFVDGDGTDPPFVISERVLGKVKQALTPEECTCLPDLPDGRAHGHCPDCEADNSKEIPY